MESLLSFFSHLTESTFGYPVAPSTLTMRKFSPTLAVPADRVTISLGEQREQERHHVHSRGNNTLTAAAATAAATAITGATGATAATAQ